MTYRRGALTVLDDQSLRIPRGGSLVVTGANGVGKSTMLMLCAGLLETDHGSIRLDGHAIDPAHPSSLVRQGVRRGVVFQQGGLVSNLSALANVSLPLRYHADVMQLNAPIIEERARFCLAAVGVDAPDIYALPGHLSFGIRKRIAFARVLAIEPNFTFFDDPDAGLDRENVELIEQILISYRDDPTVTMVVASNRRELLEKLELHPTELSDGHLRRQDLHTMPPSSLV